MCLNTHENNFSVNICSICHHKIWVHIRVILNWTFQAPVPQGEFHKLQINLGKIPFEEIKVLAKLLACFAALGFVGQSDLLCHQLSSKRKYIPETQVTWELKSPVTIPREGLCESYRPPLLLSSSSEHEVWVIALTLKKTLKNVFSSHTCTCSFYEQLHPRLVRVTRARISKLTISLF